MSPTNRHKYKYFHSTVQRAKDRRQKFHFCRLPFDVRPLNVKLNLSTNSFHPTINFSCKISSERGVFLDTEVFKGPCLSTLRILHSQTHLSPLKLSSIHNIILPPIQYKKGVFQRRSITCLRTNSVEENFYKYKRDFEQRLCNRGYPTSLVHKILTEVQFSDRKETLRNKAKKEKEILSFVTTYTPSTQNLKKILMKHWHIIQLQPRLAHIFN